MYFITNDGYELMIDAYASNLARAEMVVDGITYDADITRIVKIDYKTLRISVECNKGQGKVEFVRLYNKEGIIVLEAPRNSTKTEDEYASTVFLFDLNPAVHPSGNTLVGIGGVNE